MKLNEMVEPLLHWYDRNARILPWRENTDPYRVWVSEIMLQQTRVEAAKPYFERFMRELPTLEQLAGAEEETLLKLWEGLGYYNRVRNLQKAARKICDEYGGVFPEDYEAILSLPGIGPYTAGAISSISFGKPVPAVDGNVLRVLTRFTEDARTLTDPALKRQLTESLAAVYPKGRCGDFTQSLMELGALICVPNGAPHCTACPIAGLCAANRNGTQLSFPVQEKKQARKVQEKTVFLIQTGERIALRKREASGLLAGMWEFPNAEGALTPEEAASWLRAQGQAAEQPVRGADKTHIFTHVEWRMRCYLVSGTAESSAFVWVTPEQLEREIALPAAFQKVLDTGKIC